MGEAVKFRLVLTLILMLVVAVTVIADDDLETPWPIEERCIGEPIQPPDDWTFDGTIIAQGPLGIHGMSTQWETPQVLAFSDNWIGVGGFGTLSPDGRWYAIPQAALQTDGLYGGSVTVDSLLVYDLADRNDVLSIDWEDTYQVWLGSSSGRYYTFRTPVWFDNSTLVYQRGEDYFFIEVPSLQIEEWASPSEWENVSPVWTFVSHPSPDWSRIVLRTNDIELFNVETNEFIATVYQPVANVDLPSVAWHPTSDEFLISGALITAIHDRNGQLLEIISQPSTDGSFDNIGIRHNAYSPDGTRFAVFVRADSSATGEKVHFAVANRLEREIVDTCIDTFVSFQFSPGGRFVALLSFNSGIQELQILDVENWQLYKTDIYHDGEVIDWRED